MTKHTGQVFVPSTQKSYGAYWKVEAVAPVVTKYYFFGGQRVAMRVGGGTPVYLHGDHLGSASLTTDNAGGVVSQMRYAPFGTVRWQSGAMPTNYTFQSQRSEGFGLSDFSARYYDPVLGRFVSADSLVPNPKNPQSLNRYSYVRNSPVSMVDPSGHFDISAFGWGMYEAIFSANYSFWPLPGWEQRDQMVHALMTQGVDTNSTEYVAGRMVGGALATAQGFMEISDGAGSAGAGAVCLGLTDGACAPVTAAMASSGVALAGHGTTVAVHGMGDFLMNASKLRAGSQKIPSSADIAQKIGGGHAFDKHIGEFGELGISDKSAFSRFIEKIVSSAQGQDIRYLAQGRIAYWDDLSKTIVIYDPSSGDLGTAFRPQNGRAYFENLVPIK